MRSAATPTPIPRPAFAPSLIARVDVLAPVGLEVVPGVLVCVPLPASKELIELKAAVDDGWTSVEDGTWAFRVLVGDGSAVMLK